MLDVLLTSQRLFAMAFSLFIELLNLRYRAKRWPVTLHHRFENTGS